MARRYSVFAVDSGVRNAGWDGNTGRHPILSAQRYPTVPVIVRLLELDMSVLSIDVKNTPCRNMMFHV